MDNDRAILLRIAISDITVSSNPGVSTRITLWPFTSKGGEYETSAVREIKLSPTGAQLKPLALLTN